MPQPEPGDVPVDELRPLLADKRLSFDAVGIYAYLRSLELEGKGPISGGDIAYGNRHNDPDAALSAIRDLVLAGYLTETENGYLSTDRRTT